MKVINRWFFQDDQESLWEIVFALIVTLVFIVLSLLVFWPLGRLALAGHLAKGLGLLWLVVLLVTIVTIQIQRLFRANLYDNFNFYLATNLLVSSVLQVGWAAFAALAIPAFMAGAATWILIIAYVFGALSCVAAFFIVSAFYQGEIYKAVSFPLALLGFLVFSLWPAAARMLFGWFFDLF